MSEKDALALPNQALLASFARLAEAVLSPLGSRWLHVHGVACVALRISSLFAPDDAWHLIAAAYLHDVGYAPALWHTGFHAVDGALFLRQQGYERLACLVAHHSEARFEAHLRGLEDLLLRSASRTKTSFSERSSSIRSSRDAARSPAMWRSRAMRARTCWPRGAFLPGCRSQPVAAPLPSAATRARRVAALAPELATLPVHHWPAPAPAGQ
ncbi:HD domain-containing protein [Thermogemmatispora aurantia]|uniref:HD domain-containing protein n=1 Tax=Thermogemmatispora aurantia TaxID=2045279 RepID=UPI00124D89A8